MRLESTLAHTTLNANCGKQTQEYLHHVGWEEVTMQVIEINKSGT